MSADSQPLPALATEFRGPRVLIRPYRPEDAQDVFDAVNESRDRIKEWMPWAEEGHRVLADSHEFIERVTRNWEERTDLVLGIWDAESGRFLGGTGYHCHGWDVPYLEIGYWIRDGVVGKGYVREAVQVLARYAFEQLRVNRLEIRCDARNDRSRRIPESLGFLLEGRLRNNMRDHFSELRDTLVYALTPVDYAAVSPGWSQDGT